MKRLSEGQIKRIRELRGTGLSFRQIGRRLEIPHTLAFYYAKDVPNVERKVHEKIQERATHLLDQINKMKGAASKIYEIEGIPTALVHLPVTVTCPHCGKGDNHLWLCMQCGVFVCMGCGKDIDLKVVAREIGLSLR